MEGKATELPGWAKWVALAFAALASGAAIVGVAAMQDLTPVLAPYRSPLFLVAGFCLVVAVAFSGTGAFLAARQSGQTVLEWWRNRRRRPRTSSVEFTEAVRIQDHGWPKPEEFPRGSSARLLATTAREVVDQGLGRYQRWARRWPYLVRRRLKRGPKPVGTVEPKREFDERLAKDHEARNQKWLDAFTAVDVGTKICSEYDRLKSADEPLSIQNWKAFYENLGWFDTCLSDIGRWDFDAYRERVLHAFLMKDREELERAVEWLGIKLAEARAWLERQKPRGY